MEDKFSGERPLNETVNVQMGGMPVPEVKQNNTLGVVSLVSGISGLILSVCCSPIGVLLGIVALVCGVIANGKNQKFALAGIILGAVSLTLGILISLFIMPFILIEFFEAFLEGYNSY